MMFSMKNAERSYAKFSLLLEPIELGMLFGDVWRLSFVIKDLFDCFIHKIF